MKIMEIDDIFKKYIFLMYFLAFFHFFSSDRRLTIEYLYRNNYNLKESV